MSITHQSNICCHILSDFPALPTPMWMTSVFSDVTDHMLLTCLFVWHELLMSKGLLAVLQFDQASKVAKSRLQCVVVWCCCSFSSCTALPLSGRWVWDLCYQGLLWSPWPLVWHSVQEFILFVIHRDSQPSYFSDVATAADDCDLTDCNCHWTHCSCCCYPLCILFLCFLTHIMWCTSSCQADRAAVWKLRTAICIRYISIYKCSAARQQYLLQSRTTNVVLPLGSGGRRLGCTVERCWWKETTHSLNAGGRIGHGVVDCVDDVSHLCPFA